MDDVGIDIIYLLGSIVLKSVVSMERTLLNTYKLYSCDREGLRVMRCITDGSEFRVLAKKNTTGGWMKR